MRTQGKIRIGTRTYNRTVCEVRYDDTARCDAGRVLIDGRWINVWFKGGAWIEHKPEPMFAGTDKYFGPAPRRPQGDER